MKVAIWGSYNYGNYGDDVMAIMISQQLQKLGVTPCVYRLNRKLSEQYNVNTTDSLYELFKEAKFCIVGGGTVLIEPLFGSIGSAMNEDIRQLWEIINSEKCPLFCISMGGDGTGVTDRKLTLYQWRLLESELFRGGTVRLQQDVELFEKIGKNISLFPDIVLSLNSFWQTEQKSNTPQETLHVGLCLSNTPDTKKFAYLLNKIAYLRRQTIFHFVHPHQSDNNLTDFSLLPPKSPWIQHHFYQDPATTIQFISTLDLLISSYMHPNITALAASVPIYSLDSRAKTIAVMESLSIKFASYPLGKRSLFKLLMQLSSKKSILEVRDRFDFEKIEQVKMLAQGHFQYLTRLVEEFSEQ